MYFLISVPIPVFMLYYFLLNKLFAPGQRFVLGPWSVVRSPQSVVQNFIPTALEGGVTFQQESLAVEDIYGLT